MSERTVSSMHDARDAEDLRLLENGDHSALAFLARQALEMSVARSLSIKAAGTESCPARAQLLCLPEYISTAMRSRRLSCGVCFPALATSTHMSSPRPGMSFPAGSTASSDSRSSLCDFASLRRLRT